MSDIFILYVAFSYFSVLMCSLRMEAPKIVAISCVFISPITLALIAGVFMSNYLDSLE